MPFKIWLRVKLPEKELQTLQQEFSNCDIRQGDEASMDPQWLPRVDAVFTEEPIPDGLVQRMTNLKWLHVTRGGVNVYLTPTVKGRPIQVTGSKGIHGTVFSEFALACDIHAREKVARVHRRTARETVAEDSSPIEVAGKTVGIIGLGTVGDELARKAKALGMRVSATKRTATAKPDYVDELGTPDFMPAVARRNPISSFCCSPRCRRLSTSSANTNCA